ncbi:MAG: hypothetical protein ACLRZ6_11165 [Lachnospiraceae bacterium]
MNHHLLTEILVMNLVDGMSWQMVCIDRTGAKLEMSRMQQHRYFLQVAM